MIKRHPLRTALARLHRNHQRTWFGNCKCGWKRDLMSWSDHSDHVAQAMVDHVHQIIRAEMIKREK